VSIIWFCFGRNLQMKPNLVKFKLVIMGLILLQITTNSKISVLYTRKKLYMLLLGGTLSTNWGYKIIQKVFGRNGCS
jgi:hypothetical protein